jgi:hypothetical protein
MRPILLFLIFLFPGFLSYAQQSHFVYLQTDNKQPFYIRLNEKLYSSSQSGHVVIPKLNTGKYTLSVGFPQNEWPAQNLVITIAEKDLGFILKNFNNEGWGLFNLQTLEVVKTILESNPQQIQSTEIKTDEFSNVLADVVNTPSIKEKNKEVIMASPQEKQEALIKVEPVIEVKKIIETVGIQKLSSSVDSGGLVMTYLDKQFDGIDTIGVFISLQNNDAVLQIPVIEVQESALIQKKTETNKEIESKEIESKSSPKFIEIELPNPNSQANSQPSPPINQDSLKVPENENTAIHKPALVPVMINSDCKQMATEDDFLKIRKKMAAEKKDDEMIIVAKKMFKQKCYSTEQIKNLSVLFLKDEAKYKLFDAAYPYVYDSQLFKQLEFLLSDQYIITRFRAMIRN